MSKSMIVFSDTKPEEIFADWNKVPDGYSTRNRWDYHHRTVIKGQKAKAAVQLEIVHELTTEIRLINLYQITQTSPLKTISEQRLARRAFHDYFIGPSDKTKYIRWTTGDWVGEGDDRYWDKTIDKQGWRESKHRMTWAKTKEHLTGAELYGIFGLERSELISGYHYGLIDLDLHNQPYELFIKRLHVLVDYFHGKLSCHFQVSNELARGIHLILFNHEKRSIKVRWLENQIRLLHEAHPECEFVKDGKINIELYPNTTNPHRLPLDPQRTMLLGEPLDLVKSGKRMTQDVVGYIDWLQDPQRSYMSKTEVLKFVEDRLDLSCSSTFGSKVQAEKNSSQTISEEASQPKSGSVKMKGKTRGKIVGYWLDGEPQHFKHLNSAIHTLLQALHAEGFSEDQAVELIDSYIDDLDVEYSSRLENERSAIDCSLRQMASKEWKKSINGKWSRSVQHWSTIGFHVSDKTTWLIKYKKRETKVDCEEIEFDEVELRLITEQLAPIIVGEKQALKPEKQQRVINAVAYFLRYVRCCDREITIQALPDILSGFSVKVKRFEKQTKFFRLLKNWGWIYVRAEYYQPKVHGGRQGKGRARAYGIGKAMIHKFGGLPSITQQPPIRSILLSSTFYKDADIKRIVGHFEVV